MRMAAILVVVLGHSSILLENTVLKDFPYFKPVDGVDLFFVLSGFLIGGIMLRDFNQSSSIYELLSFWKRRWFRTLPLYFLILGLNYVVVKNEWIKGDIEQANSTFLCFLQNLTEPFYDFFWESWSLSVEEWFYLTSPVLFFLLLKLKPHAPDILSPHQSHNVFFFPRLARQPPVDGHPSHTANEAVEPSCPRLARVHGSGLGNVRRSSQ